MYTKRTNILLTEEDHLVLRALAQEEDKTIGELIRQAIKKTYKLNGLTNKRKEVLDKIDNLAKKVNSRGVNYKALIEDGRRH